MTLRTRVGLAGGVVVLLALAVAALVIYPTVRAHMSHQLDESLIQTVEQSPSIAVQLKQKLEVTGRTTPIDSPVNLGSVLVQFISPPIITGPNPFIAISTRDVAVAKGNGLAYFQNASYRGADYRVYTAQ